MTLLRDTDRIESDRLILRRMRPADLDFLTRLHSDPAVARYIGHGQPRSAQESREWLQYSLESYETLGLGQLAVLRKSDGELIGRCGLSDLAVEAHPVDSAVPKAWFQRTQVPANTELEFACELGYTFDRSSWGTDMQAKPRDGFSTTRAKRCKARASCRSSTRRMFDHCDWRSASVCNVTAASR